MERSQDEHTPTVAERKGGGRGGKGKAGRKGERGKENESLRAGRDEWATIHNPVTDYFPIKAYPIIDYFPLIAHSVKDYFPIIRPAIVLHIISNQSSGIFSGSWFKRESYLRRQIAVLKPVPISGIIGHQGRIHPGQSANPSQGTHTHTTDYLEMPINLQCMSLDWGRKSPRNRENMQTPHTHGRGRNRTPNPGGVWQMC
ncbi:hypothetical protein QTP86_031978 [Hemibagrus guttatus]|nr:hypothetical protein QTP86_031978 [Hemibagrus guttatus]